ncbi:ligase-associated DNA damage response endonuclease PdeM [Acidisoma sp. 7E03]
MSTAAPLHIGGERLMLDPSGAVYWPARNLLILADLHLEKGSAAAARGRLLPPYDSRVTLDRMAQLLRHYSAKAVLALGDSFHDAAGPARLPEAERARLAALGARVEFLWVLGNHDAALPADLPGRVVPEWADGPFRFRHIAESGPGAEGVELSGHYHPKATVPVRGTSITRPCFLTDGQRRLILPAFGSYTGGLDVADPALARLFPRGGRIFLLGEGRLFHFHIARARAGAAVPA